MTEATTLLAPCCGAITSAEFLWPIPPAVAARGGVADTLHALRPALERAGWWCDSCRELAIRLGLWTRSALHALHGAPAEHVARLRAKGL